MSEDDFHQPQEKKWYEKIKSWFSNEPLRKENLIEQLRDAENRDVLEKDVRLIMEGALRVSVRKVRDIMIPRSQMVCLSIHDQQKDVVKKVMETGHSRYPVTGESFDEVIGILLAKDLLSFLCGKNEQNFDLKLIIRPAIFVPESKRLSVLLRDFQTNRNHMAVIANEYGGVAGLVTIEDILEEIVGDITDEYDKEDDHFIKCIGQEKYVINALTPIEEFNDFFHVSLCNEEFDTIGGLVIQNFGRMPKPDESVVLDQFKFQVANADNRRIRLFYMSLLEKN